MIANSILTRAADILQDSTNIRWVVDELLRYASDGQREVVLHRPDACASNISHQLTSGVTKQVIPASAYRLLDVVRNMGANGATPGRAIRIVEREVLDAQRPDWHIEPAESAIKHFVFDNRDPRTFYVYPRPSSALYVEIICSSAPVDLSSPSQALSIPDIYANALLDYVLFRAYQKDAEYANNGQRALAYYQAFVTALGVKGAVDTQFGPTANSPLNPNSPVSASAVGAN